MWGPSSALHCKNNIHAGCIRLIDFSKETRFETYWKFQESITEKKVHKVSKLQEIIILDSRDVSRYLRVMLRRLKAKLGGI